jgi:hypothetical protein
MCVRSVASIATLGGSNCRQERRAASVRFINWKLASFLKEQNGNIYCTLTKEGAGFHLQLWCIVPQLRRYTACVQQEALRARAPILLLLGE